MTTERVRILDLADAAMHYAKLDRRLASETRAERVASDRSTDCDDYRALLEMARPPEAGDVRE